VIKGRLNFFGDRVWNRVLAVSVVLFFVYLGDAILSDWVPGFMQESLGGSLVMGVVMSFSSIVGFGADLIFPQLLRLTTANKLMTLAMGSSLVFAGVLLWSIQWPVVALFLVAMAVWGVYYEFLGFGGAQFVSETVQPAERAGVWAVIGVFKSLAYFLGPILGSYLFLSQGNRPVVLLAAGFVSLGYLIWRLLGKLKKARESVMTEPGEKLNLLDEMGHWWVLFGHVWPILMVSLFLGLIDATFWTTGAVLSDTLAQKHWAGGMFLPFYMLPPVIVGLLVAKWGIKSGKKKMAEKFMALGGLALTLLGLGDSLWLMLGAALVCGAVLSVAWPLTDAVYSDIIARMGRERKHMIGLSNSTISLAYIIGPVAAGALASVMGERLTFVAVGLGTVAVAVVLLQVTPRKLRLPQAEIQEWN